MFLETSLRLMPERIKSDPTASVLYDNGEAFRWQTGRH